MPEILGRDQNRLCTHDLGRNKEMTHTFMQVQQFHKQGQDPIQQFNLGKFSVNATDVDEILWEGGPTGSSAAYVREVRLQS